MTRMVTAVVLAPAVAFSLSACSGSNTPPASPESTLSASPAGTTITTGPADKNGKYEKLALDPNSPVYSYEDAMYTNVAAYGWTRDDITTGKRLAVDYVVTEFLDSSALEGGDAAYRTWYETEAKKYFSDKMYASIADGSGTLTIGNMAGRFMVPDLIKDGSPRMKNLNMSVSKIADNTQGDFKGVSYTLEYSGNYRVTDASAANFMSEYIAKKLGPEKHLTPEQYIASDMAKPQLKDGTGENNMRIGGSVDVILTKNSEGKFVIDGFHNKSSLNTDDFTQNDEEYFRAS